MITFPEYVEPDPADPHGIQLAPILAPILAPPPPVADLWHACMTCGEPGAPWTGIEYRHPGCRPDPAPRFAELRSTGIGFAR